MLCDRIKQMSRILSVANISSVFTNDKAIEINIQIIRAFVTMRIFLISNIKVFQRFDNVEQKQI